MRLGGYNKSNMDSLKALQNLSGCCLLYTSHKEKLSAFQERRKKEGAGVSKRDVARYMNQQRKEAEEPVNNAFAKALAGLKLDPKQ